MAKALRKPKLNQKRPTKRPARESNGSPEASIVRHLSRIPEVDAIFVSRHLGGWRVYSVIPEHSLKITGKVIRAEDRIEDEFPNREFDFRLRAHQGRPPARAVPQNLTLLFTR